MSSEPPAVGLTEERRLGGAGMRITPAERREIAIAYLSEPDLGTISACAKHFNRTREAVAGCLKGDEFDALRRQVDHEAGEAAKGILKRARVKAATAWVDKAIDAAAEKGDHKPARDLLIVTKVVQPLPSSGGVFIAVNVNGPGPTRWQGPDGVVLDEAPEDADLLVQVGARPGDVKVLPERPMRWTDENGVIVDELPEGATGIILGGDARDLTFPATAPATRTAVDVPDLQRGPASGSLQP